MSPARNVTFGQWAQQIYGPPVVSPINAHNIVEHLVYAKCLGDSSTSSLTFPPKTPLLAKSFDGTSTTLETESHFAASTHKTTPESLATTNPTRLGPATNDRSAPPNHTDALPQENVTKLPPAPQPAEMLRWMYRYLSRIEQLEYLVRLKIKTFREHLGVPYVFLNTQLRNIDGEERERRRNFFERNGEEAFLARYINSDYTGRVEFLYIAPEEVY